MKQRKSESPPKRAVKTGKSTRTRTVKRAKKTAASVTADVAPIKPKTVRAKVKSARSKSVAVAPKPVAPVKPVTPGKIVVPAKAAVSAKPAAPVKPLAPAKAIVPGKVVVPPEAVVSTKAAAPIKRAAAKTRKPHAPVPESKEPAQRAPLKIPPILLEGDTSPPPPASGPGGRYILGPAPQAASLPSGGAELPDSYGTKQLVLTARDPHWLYAHWDFSAEQLNKYNALSADGHLLLRLYRDALTGEPLEQIHLHPESRHWFVPAPDAGAKYLTSLGYYDAAKKWVELAVSGATMTPPDDVTEDKAVRFATIPLEVPFAQLLASVKEAVRHHAPLAEAVAEAVAEAAAGVPEIVATGMAEAATVVTEKPASAPASATRAPIQIPSGSVVRPRSKLAQPTPAETFSMLPEPDQIAGPWTPAQEKALATVISIDQTRRIWIGSLEVTELIRRQLQQDISSIAAAQFGQPSAPASPAEAFGGVSSPSGGPARSRGFWFNVNAELIVYGATEPDAVVTIGGRQIKLRRDGSFSFRFALPDGEYELPAEARAADGEETRGAALRFRRQSAYHGGVGAHPQDDQLQPPLVSSVA